ncbi:TolB family protein [Mesoterricola sediminis]|uniref:WD40-like Beta Propeller Repeat n=1 Tax=Mesoterricola sediminis TaxID=2927980 RepID=A0AA48KFB2_9BACT|nr:hypothetical protein [Mesoterricola sediminis]BDU78142.1 hypothetical protein METESE_31000 [Mesoterricola sediminis]
MLRSALALPLAVACAATPPPAPKLFLADARSIALFPGPDRDTWLVSRNVSDLQVAHREGTGWSVPAPLPFCGPHRYGDPWFSPDGAWLYFWSNRHPDPAHTAPDSTTHLWRARRAAEGWGPAEHLPVTVQGQPGGLVFPSLAPDGDLYFTSQRGSLGRRDLFRARKTGEGFAAPENLGPPVNSAADEFDAALDPTGQCLVFTRADATGCDLFLSRREGGGWGAPRKLGPEVNGSHGAYCPSFSPDGKTFFFTTPGGSGWAPGIYQVGAEVLAFRAPAAPAVPVAPGRISVPGAFGITFSPDGNTVCFASARAQINLARRRARVEEQLDLPFTQAYHNLSPALSPDGATAIFASNRPGPGARSDASAHHAAFWMTRREAGTWGPPRYLDNLVDPSRDLFIDSPSLAADGTLYFTAVSVPGSNRSHLFCAVPDGDGYRARPLGPELDRPDSDQSDVAVSPAGDLLVFSSDRPGGAGGLDLYQSRRRPDGTWEPAQPLHALNTPGPDANPRITPDGKTLLFFSIRDGKPGIYEVPLQACGR